MKSYPMKKYAVFGASGFGREVMPLVRAGLGVDAGDVDLVFVDDHPAVPEQNGHRVVSFADWIGEPATERKIVIAIANSQVRARIEARCMEHGIGFLDVAAPSSLNMDGVEMGPGAILCPFVTITSNVRIGRQFHANLYSYVAHDCVIGDYVTFAPAVKCNGNVVIEDHAYLGTGAIIRQGTPGSPLVIGRGATVGMGAVVTKSVPAGVTVVGNPARPLVRD